jgi:hypothetical protein
VRQPPSNAGASRASVKTLASRRKQLRGRVDPDLLGPGIGGLLLAVAMSGRPAGWRSWKFAAGVRAQRFHERHGSVGAAAGRYPGSPPAGRFEAGAAWTVFGVSYTEGEAPGDGWRVMFWAVGGRGVRTPR